MPNKPKTFRPPQSKPKGKRAPDHRPSACKRLYGRRWRKARKAFLAQHPWCVECEKTGGDSIARVVDHIAPHGGDVKLFWDRSNWQSLCTRHHNRKTSRERNIKTTNAP